MGAGDLLPTRWVLLEKYFVEEVYLLYRCSWLAVVKETPFESLVVFLVIDFVGGCVICIFVLSSF